MLTASYHLSSAPCIRPYTDTSSPLRPPLYRQEGTHAETGRAAGAPGLRPAARRKRPGKFPQPRGPLQAQGGLHSHPTSIPRAHRTFALGGVVCRLLQGGHHPAAFLAGRRLL